MNKQEPMPRVGDGATVYHYSDRSAATVVGVTAKTVSIQMDVATRIDQNGMSDVQEYSYTPNPNAPVRRCYRHKNGRWYVRGERIVFGSRNAYHDYSF